MNNNQERGRITMASPGMPDAPSYTLDELRESAADFSAAMAESRQPSLESIARRTYGKQAKMGDVEQRAPARSMQQPARQTQEDLSDLVETVDPVAVYRKFNSPKKNT